MEASQGAALIETLVPLIGLVVVIVLGVIFMVFQFQRSLFRQRLAKENLKSEHQQALLRTAIAVQEEERQRISRDLHDALGARLSVALMQLKQVRGQHQGSAEKLEAALPQLEHHMEEALSTTKRISYELMPPQLINLGLLQALHVLIGEAQEASEVNIQLSSEAALDQLPWPVQLGVYRMVAELLNNTLKYAEATTVSIVFHQSDHQLECRYTDNGKGLPTDHAPRGQGLLNLEARTGALCGHLSMGNGENGGFQATIALPLASG